VYNIKNYLGEQMEYGLCCLFWEEPIKFKTYTYAGITKLLKEKGMDSAREKVFGIWQHNVDTLQKAIVYCRDHDIKSYRVGSDLLPQLHRMIGDGIATQDHLEEYTQKLSQINSDGIILSMHPGQHVNMGSPSTDVVTNSVRDLKDHFFVAKPLGCTEINIHLGGGYGDKPAAMARFIENMKTLLTPEELSWITIENDELTYGVDECLTVAKELGIRVTFDIHHHRCWKINNPDYTDSEIELFNKCCVTWNDYGYQRLHISTPKNGYSTASKSRSHHDFITPTDLPMWLADIPNVHVDIEAKAKETAIFKLRESLEK
jgi:UV DNA damage endonuclease